MTETQTAAPAPVVKKESRMLTLHEINKRTVALQDKNNVFNSALHRLTEDLRKRLRAAFDAGTDVSKFVLSLAEETADLPDSSAKKPAAPKKAVKK